MRFVGQKVTSSPIQANSLRIAADFEMERSRTALNIWFDVPAECGCDLPETGDPWLVLMLPLAMSSGEDISLPSPIDPHLLENIQGMMRFWHAAYPKLTPVRIDAPVCTAHRRSGNRHGIYFSGGIDSTFSLSRHDKLATGCGSDIVDDLIFIAGLDIPISNTDEIEMAQERLSRIAAAHDKHLLRIGTNLRTPGTPYVTNWPLFYGCALGAIGHLLAGRFGEIIISSGLCYGDRPITGSHPITDPLLNSRQLRFVHDGASFTRVEKTQQIAAVTDLLGSVRVCWESKRHDNCSRCQKCLLTMVTLDLAGFRDRADCFDWSDYSVDKLRSMFVDSEIQAIFFHELLAEARKCGRTDIAGVVADILEASNRVRTITARIRRVPLLWRYDYQISHFLLHRIFGRNGAGYSV
jgi:hypothetical protein